MRNWGVLGALALLGLVLVGMSRRGKTEEAGAPPIRSLTAAPPIRSLTAAPYYEGQRVFLVIDGQEQIVTIVSLTPARQGDWQIVYRTEGGALGTTTLR